MRPLRYTRDLVHIARTTDHFVIGNKPAGRTRPTIATIKRLVTNPSVRAGTLMVMASRADRSHWIYRNLLITLHSCDVSQGAKIEGPLMLPHPIGIVIGAGVVIETDVTIYQGVTLGTDKSGVYPRIGSGATIYTDATIIVPVTIHPNQKVRAKAFIRPEE